MELAIDTSTKVATLALSDRGDVIAAFTWLAGQNHTAELIPNLRHLLSQAQITLQDMEGIVVAKGPGSFNGLRVGIAAVKGLSFALDIPLVGISTLEAIAFPYAAIGLPICPILNAGRGEIATALFQSRNSTWLRLIAEHITNIENLCEEAHGQIIFCGEINPEIASSLRGKLGENALILQGLAMLGTANCLSKLGWQKLETHDYDDTATLQPSYLRKPAITIPKGRRYHEVSDMRS